MSAKVIGSCDDRYWATDVVRGRITIKDGSRNIGSVNVDHAVRGGRFSLDGSVLVVFGLPNVFDVNYPQTTHLSVLSIKPKVKVIEN